MLFVVRERLGTPVCLSAEVIGCGGDKLFTGFSDMPERVPGFVSLKEKYKKTPEMVVDYIRGLGIANLNQGYDIETREDEKIIGAMCGFKKYADGR